VLNALSKKGTDMKKSKVLFVCVHNSARSQMAEAFLKVMAGDKFHVESAGLTPGAINPLVVDAMSEIGIDISRNKTSSVFDCYKAGKLFDYVITVCDEASAEKCPIFAGITKRLHWGFEDPSKLEGTDEQKMKGIRNIRDAIKTRIEDWLSELK